MGMFCRFGSVEDSRPVAATVWLNVVWIRPFSPAIGISESTIDISLATSLCRSRCLSTGFSVCASKLVSSSILRMRGCSPLSFRSPPFNRAARISRTSAPNPLLSTNST